MQDNTFTDPRDGQVYKIVKIGEQIWFAENFRYRDFASSVYNNDESNEEKYGRLYLLSAAMYGVPDGWHLPTISEWEQLKKYIEANTKTPVGTALKSKTDWNADPRTPTGTDEFGFNALPAGFKNLLRKHVGLKKNTWFWAAPDDEDIDDGEGFLCNLHHDNEKLCKKWIKSKIDDFRHYSVRLVKGDVKLTQKKKTHQLFNELAPKCDAEKLNLMWEVEKAMRRFRKEHPDLDYEWGLKTAKEWNVI
ncbi:MAG: hypothetical protein MJZ22_02900 [Candidatus Saccharibacteria bacterium]|nr:hypothetical protein [Candidatus Saccharibacteria bacterium]